MSTCEADLSDSEVKLARVNYSYQKRSKELAKKKKKEDKRQLKLARVKNPSTENEVQPSPESPQENQT